MERRIESKSKSNPFAVTGLALLGPAFGVATQVWGQALLLLGLATLLILAPPRRAPGALWCILFLAIGAIGLVGFLPSQWFVMPEWRRMLAADFRVELPGTMSPQPWVSAHCFCLLFAGLVYALYLVAQDWSPRRRREALAWYAVGILILAIVALASLAIGHRVPFWPEVLNVASKFGFFPNRNQTANVLALAGIVSTALAFESFERKRNAGWFWATAAVAIGISVVQAYSRAGILLFFGGTAVWVIVSFAFSRSHKGVALSVAGIALALTAFFALGGETLERFLPKTEGEFQDFRFKIHRDAVRLTGTAPWFGQGLGNFAPVFAMSRDASAEQNRAIHPESDWLWVAVEMGWPAVVLFGGAFLLWLRQCFPFSEGSDRSLRSAAMVCGVAFALHSFADVSGHRPGSAWAALFLAGLAIAPKRGLQPRRWVAPVFRALGVIVALISGWWFLSLWSEQVGKVAPTLQTLARLTERVDQANARGDFSAAVLDASEALRVSPLNADLYYKRGVARVGEGFSVHGAAWDFGTARFLEPRWVQICVTEGNVWQVANQPALALDAWREGLRRAGARAPEYYGQMLGRTRNNTLVRSELARFSRASPDYLVVFLQQSDNLECELLIGQLIEAEPKLESFSSEQRKALFSVWYQRGDRSLLISSLLANPEWQKEGWLWLAYSFAEKKEFERAFQIARESIPAPTVPEFSTGKSLVELERAFRFRGEDLQAGIEYFAAQRAAGMTAEALETVISLQRVKTHPAYLVFLEAELWSEKAEWQKAWDALRRFKERGPR